ncbi:MAG: conjugal transfer protein TraH, partial [Terriglobia bacterium]|nr:conjugal transfer protein TraH [Terriglobia bacterium]
MEPKCMFKSPRYCSLAAVFAACLGLCLLAPRTASAGGVDQALSNLFGGHSSATSNTPGYYQSEARGVFVAGGGDVRFPSRQYPSLYSLTMPGFHAGCGGISVYFGGFSFISGDQIKQMIQSVAQNSVGMAIDLAMTTLCAPCAHVMQVMRALAKDAAATSINSCQAARALMQRSGLTKLLGGDSSHTDKEQDTCSLSSSKSGASSDFLSSMESLCNGADKAASWLQTNLTSEMQSLGISGSSPSGAQFLCNGGGPCNTMWTLLSQTQLEGDDSGSIRDRLMLMNVIGTNVYCGADCSSQQSAAGSASGAVNVQGNVAYYPPMLGNVGSKNGPSMDQVFTLFMCGTSWQSASYQYPDVAVIVKNFCSVAGQSYSSSFNSLPVWQCAPGK